MALLAVVVAIDQWGIRWLQAPWSYPSLGPTLTGTWEGPLRARPGQGYRLYLELPDGRFAQARTVSSADPDDRFGPIELRNADRASFLAARGRLGG